MRESGEGVSVLVEAGIGGGAAHVVREPERAGPTLCRVETNVRVLPVLVRGGTPVLGIRGAGVLRQEEGHLRKNRIHTALGTRHRIPRVAAPAPARLSWV